jgi:hypothetical protein
MVKDTIGPGEPAIGFSLDCKINDRRAFVIQTYLPISATPKEINAMLDKLHAAADRQEVRYRLKDMRLLLEKAEQELPLHEKKLVEFEEGAIRRHKTSGRRADFEWKGNDATNRDNLIQTVAMTRVNIERIKKGIAEAEAELKDT